MQQGWEIKKLGEVCSFERGLIYAKGDEVATSSKGVLRSNNIDLITNSLNYDEIKYLREDFEIPTKKMVRKNSLLMCISNGSKIHLGKVALIEDDIDYAFGGFMGLLTPNEAIIHPRYFYYALISPAYKMLIKGLSDGANINNLKFADLQSFEIPIPSLAEQERIVEILDREFERIDALKANAEKSLQHAKDLLKQSQNTVFNSIETFPLDSMVTIINGYAFKSEDFSKTNPVKAVKITNVGVGVFIETIDTNLPQSLLLDKQDYTVHTGDIVFALTRTIIAAGLKVAIVPESYNCALLNQRVAALRIDDDIQRKYLYNYFQTASVKEYVLKKVNTLMQPNLSIKDLKAMPIPYCNRAEMEQVVARLDKLKENSQVLEDNYKKTIALCDDMKQALLRKVFNGEL